MNAKVHQSIYSWRMNEYNFWKVPEACNNKSTVTTLKPTSGIDLYVAWTRNSALIKEVCPYFSAVLTEGLNCTCVWVLCARSWVKVGKHIWPLNVAYQSFDSDQEELEIYQSRLAYIRDDIGETRVVIEEVATSLAAEQIKASRIRVHCQGWK